MAQEADAAIWHNARMKVYSGALRRLLCRDRY
jgi:hypothetical protein